MRYVKGMLDRHPLLVCEALASPVPFLRNQHTNPDDDAGFLVPVRLIRGEPIVAEGAVGNPNLILGEMVVYRSNGAKVMVLLAPLEVDDLSFLCHR